MNECLNRIGNLEKSVGKLDARVGGLEKSVGKLDARVGGLEKSVDKLDARVGNLEKSVGKLDTRVGGLEKSVSSLDARVGKLETVIEERFQHFEKHLEKMESSLTAKLDKIDEDIRGNGKLGMNVRLDRLENSQKLASRWFWIVVGAATPALVGIYLSWLGITVN